MKSYFIINFNNYLRMSLLRLLLILVCLNSKRLAILGIYYQNNPFLGMFQLKFYIETFEACSLLYVSDLKCSILAIALFK